LLKIALDIESEYIKAKDTLPSLPYGQEQYLEVLAHMHFLQTDLFRISCASIMMFQAMLEAVINDAVEKESALSSVRKDGNFWNKWNDALNRLSQDIQSFSSYHTSIYKKYRNPIVHPKEIEANSFNDLSVQELHRGYSDGWHAFSSLYSGLGHPLDNGSWGIMCNAHQLPSTM
jgi:hypothetical protein